MPCGRAERVHAIDERGRKGVLPAAQQADLHDGIRSPSLTSSLESLARAARRVSTLSRVSSTSRCTTARRSPVSRYTCSCRSALVPVAQDRVDVLDLPAGCPSSSTTSSTNSSSSSGELAHRHLLPLAEVDQLAVDAPARGAPLVLFDQRARIAAGSPGCCARSRYSLTTIAWASAAMRDRLARRGRHVADAELERAERSDAAAGPTRSSCRCRCSAARPAG